MQSSLVNDIKKNVVFFYALNPHYLELIRLWLLFFSVLISRVVIRIYKAQST
jgi:hypothetical protein